MKENLCCRLLRRDLLQRLAGGLLFGLLLAASGALLISGVSYPHLHRKGLVVARSRPQPTYHVVQEDGPSHDKTFTVEVRVGDTAYEQGTAGSKQEAEQQAARRTLEQIATEESAT